MDVIRLNMEKCENGQADLWDTGTIQTDQSIQVVYAGKPLASRMKCFWKVMVWDKDNEPSAWSPPAHWSMGLLEPAQWQAQWIGLDTDPENVETDLINGKSTQRQSKGKRYLSAPYLRKEFRVAGTVKRAVIYATAQDFFELHLNGKRVGDECFMPGWTDYRKRIYYRTYDVTLMLTPGANAIGAILGVTTIQSMAVLSATGNEKTKRSSGA